MSLNKIVRCPICGKYRRPTVDHIPPKSCGNYDDRAFHQFAGTDYSGQLIQPNGISQGGIHSAYICSDCNNGLLGDKPDKELASIYGKTIEAISKDEPTISWEGDIRAIITSVFGHILAIAPYDKSRSAREMRQFIHKGVIPKANKLFVFIYPYKECVIYRDCVPIIPSPSENSVIKEVSGFSGLYFWPLAFVVSHESNLGCGADLTEILAQGENTLVLKSKSWINPVTERPLCPDWPLHVNDFGTDDDTCAGVMLGSAGAKGISTLEKQECSFIKVHGEGKYEFQ